MNKFFIFLALLAILAPCCFAANIGFMKDPRDGQIYKTVKIGSQTWMAENLNYETEKEILSFPGDIFGGKEFYFETFTSSCYDDRFSNCTRYGRLYKWPDVLNACPAGWHLPSHAEWNTLFATVGGKDSAGKVLKSVDGWLGGGNGSDSYGFSAIPVGYRGYADFSEFFGEVADENLYINEGRDALFWSSTELDSNNAYVVYMFYYKSKAEIVPDYKRLGLSIRCVEDSALVPDSDSKAGMTEKATLLSSSRVSMNSTTSSSSSVTLSRVEGSLTDPRDGQTYKTVKIGSQTWLAQNMNYKAANSFCYNGADSNCTKYGRLYTWAASKEACPVGWHLPITNEWRILVSTVAKLNPELERNNNPDVSFLIPSLSVSSLAGNKLKSKTGWLNNGNGADDYGFSIYPTGFRYGNGSYGTEGRYALFWRHEDPGSFLWENKVYALALNYNNDDVYEIEDYENLGLSVRCVEDVPKGSFTDSRDGQTYKTVTIDGLTWMAENLKFKMDSTASPSCGDSLEFCAKLGLYYTWEAAMGACPVGWHLPDSSEWKNLVTAVGGNPAAVEMLKSKSGWDYHGNELNGSFVTPRVYRNGGLDYYGFGVISDGTRGEKASFWSTLEHDEENSYYLELFSHAVWNCNRIGVVYGQKNKKRSVRCVKD